MMQKFPKFGEPVANRHFFAFRIPANGPEDAEKQQLRLKTMK
jgi:hypothetical protein